MITEVNSSGGWNRGEIYAGNRHVATYSNGNTYFDTTDWLGTAPMLFQTRRGPHRQDRAERVRADENGAVAETCESLPFGDELGCSGNDVSPLHFTGKQRDDETGLDYFDARYDASSLGRFMTPDWSAKVEPVPYAKLADPQSLNLYAYVLDNPTTSLDLDGHACEEATGPNACPLPPPTQTGSKSVAQKRNQVHRPHALPALAHVPGRLPPAANPAANALKGAARQELRAPTGTEPTNPLPEEPVPLPPNLTGGGPSSIIGAGEGSTPEINPETLSVTQKVILVITNILRVAGGSSDLVIAVIPHHNMLFNQLACPGGSQSANGACGT